MLPCRWVGGNDRRISLLRAAFVYKGIQNIAFKFADANGSEELAKTTIMCKERGLLFFADEHGSKHMPKVKKSKEK